MKLPTKKILGLGVVVLLAGGLLVYSKLKPEPLPQTILPIVQDLEQIVEVSGQVDAGEKASLAFAAMSRLTWVGVKEGDLVRRYQSLARVDTRVLQKQLEQQRNIFEQTFRSHDQTIADLDYYDRLDLSDEEKRRYESSQFDLRNAMLNVEIQDLAIQLSSLSSPIAGIVTRVDKPHAGETIGPTDLIQIVNPDSLYFAVVVDEIDIPLIKSGQQAVIRFDAYPNEPVTTNVGSIDFAPSAGRSGGTGYKVRLVLPADAGLLRYRLGMNGNASISIAQKPEVLTIPVDTLISRDGKTYVEVLEDGVPVRKRVVLGLETEDYAEIISGIDAKTAVILPQSAE